MGMTPAFFFLLCKNSILKDLDDLCFCFRW